jgi:hypothetical protein
MSKNGDVFQQQLICVCLPGKRKKGCQSEGVLFTEVLFVCNEMCNEKSFGLLE